jgi:hypothetical protein
VGRRDEEYAILGANVVVELNSEAGPASQPAGPGRSSAEPTATGSGPANAPDAPTAAKPSVPAAPTDPTNPTKGG